MGALTKHPQNIWNFFNISTANTAPFLQSLYIYSCVYLSPFHSSFHLCIYPLPNLPLKFLPSYHSRIRYKRKWRPFRHGFLSTSSPPLVITYFIWSYFIHSPFFHFNLLLKSKAGFTHSILSDIVVISSFSRHKKIKKYIYNTCMHERLRNLIGVKILLKNLITLLYNTLLMWCNV